jgi:trimeric autotransporter adhesin
MAQKNKSSLQSSINAEVNDNITGEITALDVRGNLIDVTDSLLFNSGSQSFTGSLTATSFTGSLLGTSSNATTASYALNAGGNSGVTKVIAGTNITIISQSGFPEGTGNITISASAGGTTFPFTGSALITGSLGVTGSISTSGLNGTINNLFISRGGGNVSSNISIGSTTNFSSSATGTHNTAIGNDALCLNTIGNYNTAIGREALLNNTTGTSNTAIGASSLNFNSTGSHNTAIGNTALFNIISGSNNIAFGQDAGCRFANNSSNNIAIGFGAGPSTTIQESNKLYIASGSGTPLIKGDFAAKTVNISGSLTATSLTGSLLGTASNAVTASYALQAVSSSFASTASFALSGVTKVTAGTNITITTPSGFPSGTGDIIISNVSVPGTNAPDGDLGSIQFNLNGLFGGVPNRNLHYDSINGLLATGSFKGSFNGLLTNTIGQLSSVDRRTISPQNSITNGTIQFGFGSFDNDDSSPYSDFIQFRTYADGTGGKENLVMFNKDEIGMRIFQQNWGSSNNFIEYKDVAFTDGTNTTGNWPINITGTASIVTTNANLTGDIGSTGNTTFINPGVIVNADINSSAGITLTKLATGELPTGITVASANIVDGSIVNADINSSAGITLTKLATGSLPTGITVNSANIANGTIVNADISSNANIALTKLATGTLPTGITVASANIVDGSIVNADINSNANIALTKLATGELPTGITVASANIVDGTITNADISTNC